MRWSSATLPCGSMGTLKSTRMKTRFPARSRASIVLSAMRGSRERLAEEVLGRVDHAVREAPLVVVPREDLRERVVDDERAGRVEDGRVRIAHVVDGDGRLVRVLEDALQLAFGGGLERGVDALRG